MNGLKLYKLSDLEEVLGVKPQTMKLWIKSGKLPAVKIAGKWRISEEALRAFMNGESK